MEEQTNLAKEKAKISPKSFGKGIGYIILGIALLAFGYWIGFVGITQGDFFYRRTTTWPIAGIIFIISGIGSIINGLKVLSGAEEKKEMKKAQLAEKYLNK